MVNHTISRFKEVELIDDSTIRSEVVSAIRDGHEVNFYKAPAASSYRHHNPYCCNKYGLWIHTKMVFTAYERLWPTYKQQGFITDEEVDYGRAACLLHDLRKHGEGYTEGDGAAKDHDIQAAEWVAANTDLPEEVCQAIATHMGPWYEGPEPKTKLDQLVHMADMTAANKNVTCGVYEPHEDIKEFYPGIPRASL